MSWKKKLREYKGKNNEYSLRKKLKREKKITDEFEIMLSTLTLEEIIGLRLEIASSYINNKLYNFPIYKSIKYLTKEACLLFALSATRTYKDAASFLGIKESDLRREIKKFKIDLTTTNYNKKIDNHNIKRG